MLYTGRAVLSHLFSEALEGWEMRNRDMVPLSNISHSG